MVTPAGSYCQHLVEERDGVGAAPQYTKMPVQTPPLAVTIGRIGVDADATAR